MIGPKVLIELVPPKVQTVSVKSKVLESLVDVWNVLKQTLDSTCRLSEQLNEAKNSSIACLNKGGD